MMPAARTRGQRVRPWIAVTGPPGSGGELIARALAEFGPALVESEPVDDRDHPSAGSGPHLAVLGDTILGLVEATWKEPPVLSDDWVLLPEVAACAPPAVVALTSALEAAHSLTGPESTKGERGAVWYDRCHPWLVPFWARYCDGLQAVVVTWRTPGATVVDLERYGLGDLHALALWEAHLVAALTACRDLPVLGVDVDSALGDPATWSAIAADFLTARGWVVGGSGPRRAAARLASERGPVAGSGSDSASAHGPVRGQSVNRHGPVDPEERAAARRLAAALGAAAGVHDPWSPSGRFRVGRWPAGLLAALVAARRSAAEEARAWATAEAALQDADIAATALDWSIDRLVEAWSGSLPEA